MRGVHLIFKLIMMTSSNGKILRVTVPLCGEFTGNPWIPLTKPVTRSFDVSFDLCLNKRLSKQSWGWWFEAPMCSIWRHWNESVITLKINQSDCRQRGRWESSQSDTFFCFNALNLNKCWFIRFCCPVPFAWKDISQEVTFIVKISVLTMR